jgi:hypothetical protein
MNKHNNQRWLLIVTLLVSFSACAPRPAVYVAVRESRFRCEGERGERIKLPLSPESRERLMTFFRNKGDNLSISTVADPEAERKYRDVLDSLGDSRNLVLGDDLSKHVFCDVAVELCRHTSLFAKLQNIRQVIDARQKSPPILDPIAVNDQTYWWVFSHHQVNHQNLLTEILVMKAVPLRMKR